MKVLVVSQDEVSALLPMGECIDAMSEALKALALGEAMMPLRQVMRLPNKKGVLAMMPSYHRDAMGVKVISVFPGNQGTEHDSHQGAVLLFEAEHGRLLAVMDASQITAIRTAAVSGVATKLLAREEAAELAILGSGVQAATHLTAMMIVRKLRHVRVWSRTSSHAESFVQSASKKTRVTITAVGSAQEAVNGADIICTVTSATDPVLKGEWIKPGAHINAAGAFGQTARELDSAAVAKSRFFVDRRESTLNESGDFLIPKSEGLVDDHHIAGEIGEILTGKVPARTSAEQITVFKSMGLAVEDLASAELIYRKAEEMGMGTSIELGGARHGA